jgi:GNAT superfamily N-acetyltransferase
MLRPTGANVQVSIREADANDLPAVFNLMRDFANREGLGRYFELTHEALVRFCFHSPKRLHVLVAASETAVVGYASYLVQFSPWAGREYLFLDDLYVVEEARGEGVGSRLMQRMGEIALEHEGDVRWHVETENRSAQKFYGALGAALRDKFIAYWFRDAIREHLENNHPD